MPPGGVVMSDDLRSEFNDSKILLAQNSGSHMERSSLATANTQRIDDPDNQDAKDKKLQRFLDIVDAANAYIDRLQKDIDDMEAAFRERDGEEWREKLALKILDPDEIPQQREGESIAEYRERLEPLLINKMLNADGSIKDEYKNHPELADYAQWAQKQYHLGKAKVAVLELDNPNTTPERATEILNTLNDIETLAYADREAAPESETQGRVKDVADENRDGIAENELHVGSSSILKPIGMN